MKKFFLLSAMLLGIICCNKMFGTDVTYYAKVTVEVAEDSKGLGTVYLEVSDEEVTEASAKQTVYDMGNSGANVPFTVIAHPADGYVLINFTDQNNNVIEFEPFDSSDPTRGNIGVPATSTDEADPSVFNLYAHFIPESELPTGELVEITIDPTVKYGTYFSPADTEIPYDARAFNVTGVEKGCVVLEEIGTGIIPAFSPVLIENTGMFETTITSNYDPEALPDPLPSFSNGLLTGTLEEIEAPAGTYILSPIFGSEGAQFSIVESENTLLNAYEAYLNAPETTSEIIKIISPLSSGVKNIIDNESEAEIFDIEGNRLEKLQKGINILNGVKVLVK